MPDVCSSVNVEECFHNTGIPQVDSGTPTYAILQIAMGS